MVTCFDIALFIDDDPLAHGLAEPLLRAEGLTLRGAHSGGEGIQLLREGLRPAVILVDLFMPGVDAVGFRRQQVSEPTWAAIPTVIMATTTFKGFRTDAMGMPLLRKPFGAADLATALQAARRGVRLPIEAAHRVR